MLERTTQSSGQAQKRPPKHERESTAGPACEQETKEEASDLRSALVRWEDEGGSWLPLTEP